MRHTVTWIVILFFCALIGILLGILALNKKIDASLTGSGYQVDRNY